MRKLLFVLTCLLAVAAPMSPQSMDSLRRECERYQEEYEQLEIRSPQSYIARKNMQRVLHEANEFRLEAQRQQNLLLFYSLVGGFVLLFLAGGAAYLFRRRIRALRCSERELEEAVEKAQCSIQAKNLFLSNMSHEIRTPLNALSGFSSILTNSLVDKETREQCNDIIQQNSDLLLKLIDDVVDLSNLEKGVLQFRFQDVEVVSLCHKVVDTVERIKQTVATVGFDSSWEQLTLYTDEARLQQLLINLLVNATKFTTEGTIRLSLERQGNMALFAVTDTGCGIAPEERQKVFNRFETLNDQRGTGLGLFIAKTIVNKVGGEIWIDPDYTEGARFCFTHPLPQDSSVGEERKEEQA